MIGPTTYAVAARAWGQGRSRRARTNGTQSTRGKPTLSLLRRRRAANNTPQAAVPLLAVPALASGRELHRALITREPAAAGDGFERHGLAAFAGCHLCGNHIESGAPSRNAEGLAPSSGGTGTSTPSSGSRVDGVGPMIQRLRRRAARI